jgi:hypothetical protein
VSDHRRFFWFEDGAIRFDAPRYARLRRITVDEAVIELRELAAKALPAVPIREEVSDRQRGAESRTHVRLLHGRCGWHSRIETDSIIKAVRGRPVRYRLGRSDHRKRRQCESTTGKSALSIIEDSLLRC